MSGGFNPSPTRYGTSKHSVFETILQALNQGDGTAISTDQATYNYCDNFAVARAIADLWSTNRRLAHLWDAARMTDTLPRWEKILHLIPASTDTTATRRAAVGAKLALWGQAPTQQVVGDMLTTIAGPASPVIVNSSSAIATGSCPAGATIFGGVTLSVGPWSSSIMHVAVQVTQPASMTSQQFYDYCGKIHSFLDGLLPAWADFSWFTTKPFNLDDLKNLDNEAFGS